MNDEHLEQEATEANRIENECLDHLRTNRIDRKQFIDKFLTVCEPTDLIHLSQRLNEYKKDFISKLPVEIVELILGYLDWKSLINCCQVNKTWRKKLTYDFNLIWYNQIFKNIAIDSSRFNALKKLETDSSINNYKHVFLYLINNSLKLENGNLFRSWQVYPYEISAITSYQNTIATATHLVKFWRYEESKSNLEPEISKKEWNCVKTMQLQSRAASLKFDDKFLITSTYFLTMDLYSLQTYQLIYQYMGHTCSITSFDFNQNLMLIVTGSADNTIKYWSMDKKGIGSINTVNHQITPSFNKLLIKTEPNLVWPMHIKLVKYDKKDSSKYFLIALLANGYIFLNEIEKIDDFESEKLTEDKKTNDQLEFEKFNFRYGLVISNAYRHIFYMQNLDFNLNQNDENIFDNENLENLLISNRSWTSFDCESMMLSVYLIAENNSNQTKKFFLKKWRLIKNTTYESFELECQEEQDSVYEENFAFLNKRSLKSLNINQYEIITFGAK
jgi:hypothetical protein